MKIHFKYALLPFLVLGLGLGGLFSHFYLLTLPVVLGGIALLLPKQLGMLFRLILAYVSFFIANILVVLVLSKFDLPFDVWWLLLGYLLIVSIGLYLKRQNLWQGQTWFCWSDVTIIGMSAVLFFLVLSPFRSEHGYSRMLEVLSMAEDNASHYAMMHATSVNKSYTYFMDAEKSGLQPSLRIYSQGQHVNMAINSHLLSPTSKPLAQPFLIKSFVLQLCAFYSLLFMVILLGIRQLTRHFIGDRSLAISLAVASPMLIYFVGFGTNIYMFETGFHTQITAYSFFLLLLLWLSLDKIAFSWRLLGGASLVTAVAFSWFFLLPIAGLVFTFWLWQQRRSFILLYKTRLLTVCSAALLLATSLVPNIIDRINQNSTHLNTPGGVLIVILPIIVLYSGLGVLFLLGLHKKDFQRTPLLSLLVVALGLSLIFSLIICMYQLSTVNELRYYFYKTLFIYPLLGIWLSSAFLANYLPGLGLWKAASRIRLGLIMLSLGLLSYTLSFGFNPAFYTKFYLEKKLAYHANVGVLAPVIEANKVVTTPQKNYDFILYDGCNEFRTYITQRWLGAILLNDSQKNRRQLYEQQLAHRPPVDLIRHQAGSTGKIEVGYYKNCLDDLPPPANLPANVNLKQF